MPKETEKMLKKLTKYIEDNSDKDSLTKEKLEELTDKFMKEYNANLDNDLFYEDKSDDYLEMAYEADNQKEAIKYCKEALKYDRDNLDAKALLLELTAKNPLDLLNKQDKLIHETENDLMEKGYYEDVGHFWGILETRPYMRLRHSYMQNLINNGMFTQAISEAEILLDLCENDNLGVRYTLMHLYTYMEELEGCRFLLKTYKENSTAMLLPLSYAYFKVQDYSKAKKYLKDLNKQNKDLLKFIKDLLSGDIKHESRMEGYYSPDTYEELNMCFEDYWFVYITCPYYFHWALDILNNKDKNYS